MLDEYLVGFLIFAEISEMLKKRIYFPVNWLKKYNFSSRYKC